MKETLSQNITEYKRQMELGNVPKAYKGLMEYMMDLRTHFKNNFTEYAIGSFYQGYMDMTYFPVAPIILKERKLKLAIVFDHSKTRFEIWLSGQNRKIQNEYLDLFKQKGLNKDYTITKNPDSIIELVVVENPNFKDLDKLTTVIEKALVKFTTDITNVLE